MPGDPGWGGSRFRDRLVRGLVRISRPQPWTGVVLALLSIVSLGLLPLSDHTAARVVLYGLLTGVAVLGALLGAQWGAVAASRVAARFAVRRARTAFRQALRAARRHPELVDLVQLRAAAGVLARHLAAQRARLPEVEEASRHPYAPIRHAAKLVLQAARVRSTAPGDQPKAASGGGLEG